MSGWTLSAIADACGGRWVVPADAGAAAPTGASIDTRTLKPGDLFAAYVGERADGHGFVLDAQERGAALVLVTYADAVAPGVTVPTLVVGEMTGALTRLAALKRRVSGARYIGVTGSNGKTTSVRLLASVLGRAGRVASSGRSFNNAIGVPVSVLDAPMNAEFVVCEIGMSTPGEIAARASLVRPDVSVITSVGRAHLEALGSVAAIAREKASILTHTQTLGVVPGSVRVLNEALEGMELACTLERVDPGRVEITRSDASGTWFALDGELFVLGAPGKHNAMNAALCVVAARALGVGDDQIREGLADAALPEMRLTLVEIPTLGDPVLVYNDAYNANPESTRASLAFFLEPESLPVTEGHGSRVVVLGDMLELGAHSEREHAAVLSDLSALEGAARVVTIGEAYAHAPGPSWVERHVSIGDETIDEVARSIGPGDRVLLKGSRGVRLERLVERIRLVHSVGAAEA